MRRYLLFAPSLLFGVIGALWLSFRPLELEAEAGLFKILVVALALTAGLLGGAYLLERTLPSFRYASRMLERAVARFRPSLPLSIGLAAATAVSEELFFRGVLLSLIGVWGQALAFGLLHPATRRGWGYTAFTFIAGLAFGYATVATGSLWAAILAHFIINLQGFLEVRRRRQRPRVVPLSSHGERSPGDTDAPEIQSRKA
jgi:membrane protease YdiL (CAAX protease family)